MANVKVEAKWYGGKKKELLDLPNKVMYSVARQTLDLTYPHIPLATYVNAGKLRQSSISAGVRGDNGNYYIGSYTDYAKYVWKMGAGTNWSTPGTYGKWYEEVWKKQGKQITTQAIERNKLK